MDMMSTETSPDEVFIYQYIMEKLGFLQYVTQTIFLF